MQPIFLAQESGYGDGDEAKADKNLLHLSGSGDRW
jgi:hypothetical protein